MDIIQNWWHKIQDHGAKSIRKRHAILEKGLSLFFGLPFLPQEQIEEFFVEDIMSEAPTDNRCVKFADYVLVTCNAGIKISTIVLDYSFNYKFQEDK